MWGEPRFHSAQYVNMMINDLWVKGVNLVQIWDDLFTINRKRLKQIIPRPGMKFNCQPRTDLIDDELCGILKGMGVTTCIFGFESGSDKTLRYLKRDTCTVGDNKKAIKICHKHGLKVQGSVIFGNPNETIEDMQKTIGFMKWAIKQGVQRLWAFVATPFPGTEWWGKLTGVPSWSQLSHYTDYPLLLSVDKKDFKKVMQDVQKIDRTFKWRKALAFIKNIYG